MDDDRDDIQRRSTGASGGDDDRTTFRPDEHPGTDVLAGYLDDREALAPADQTAIETHLAACAACREALDDLRALVSALAELPEPALPRSFALTEAMLAERDLPRRVEPRLVERREPSLWRRRQIAAVRWASAAAALLFVLVLSADLLSHTGSGGGADDDAVFTSSGGAQPEAAQTTAGDAYRNAATPELTQPAMASQAEATATTAAASTGAETTTTPASAATTEPPPADATNQALAFQNESEKATPEPSASPSSDEREGWRTLEFGLALLLAWLLAAMVVLPRLGRNQAAGEPPQPGPER